jgi:hypothetical protein
MRAMGRDELHGAMSLLPAETLSELSIVLSSMHNDDDGHGGGYRGGGGGGIHDDLAILLGKHPHVQSLCFRAAPATDDEIEQQHDRHRQQQQQQHGDHDDGTASGDKSAITLTDRGMLELIPRLPYMDKHDDQALECWEDVSDAESNCDDTDGNEAFDRFAWNYHHKNKLIHSLDMLRVQGCNIRLRRLELLNCQHVSADTVLQFFGKCSGSTHLSLAGSFLRNSQDGIDILSKLPHVLPHLQVLDVTRCPWVTTPLLSIFLEEYTALRQQHGDNLPPLPRVFCQGCYRQPRHRQAVDGEIDVASTVDLEQDWW